MSAQAESTTLTRTIVVGDDQISVELTSHTEHGTRVTLRTDDGKSAIFGVDDDVARYLQEGTPEPWAHRGIQQLGARLE